MVNTEKLRRLQMLEDSIEAQKYELISDKLKSDYPQLFDGTFGVLQLTNKERNINTVTSLDSENPCLGNFLIDNKHVWDYIVNVLYQEKPKSIYLDCDLLSSTFKPIEFTEDFYRRIDDLYNDEEYMSLCNEILELPDRSLNKLTETDFEKDDRFVVRFPEEMGIPEWTVRTCQRPSVSVVLSDDDVNPKIIGYKWNPVKITLVHPIGQLGAAKNKKIMDWFMPYMNDVFSNTETNCGRDIYIEMLDRCGCIVEKWLLSDCVVISVDFGECDYNKDRMSTTTIKVLPRHCMLVDMSS